MWEASRELNFPTVLKILRGGGSWEAPMGAKLCDRSTESGKAKPLGGPARPPGLLALAKPLQGALIPDKTAECPWSLAKPTACPS